ncbi:rlmJ, partial [Symbiodinium pilosum]
VCQYVQLQNRCNRRAPGAGQSKLQRFAGSSALFVQTARPQDQVLLLDAYPAVHEDLLRNIELLQGPLERKDVQMLCADSYRWLLQQEVSLFGNKGVVFLDPPYDSVNSFHIWNLFMIQFLRTRWPSLTVALWYPFIDEVQTANLHKRLADLGVGDVLVAEMEVERPFQEQAFRSGVALMGAPVDLKSKLVGELSSLGELFGN